MSYKQYPSSKKSAACGDHIAVGLKGNGGDFDDEDDCDLDGAVDLDEVDCVRVKCHSQELSDMS